MQKLTSRLLKLSAIGLCAFTAVTASAGDYSKKAIVPPPQCPPWYITLGGGAEFDSDATKFFPDFGGYVLTPTGEVPTIFLNSLTAQAADFAHTHDVTASARAELGYFFNQYVAVFAGFTYNSASGKDNVFMGDSTLFGNEFEVRADVSDYTAYSARLGFRLYAPDSWVCWTHLPLKAYFAYSAGGKSTNGTDISFFVPGIERIDLNDFYDSGWIFTNDMQVGVEFKLFGCATIGLESGIGYDTKLHRNDHRRMVDYDLLLEDGAVVIDTANFLVTGVNMGGDRFYVPLTGYIKFRF
jgi:hypothetical protein